MTGMSSKDPLNHTEWLDNFDLNPRRRDFVLAYLIDPNASKAAEKVGYAHAHTQGPRLLEIVAVRDAIEEGRRRIEQASMLEATDIAKIWSNLALADPGELVQHHRCACRYCYGIEHEYQWRSPREYREAFKEAVFKIFPKAEDRKSALLGGIDPELDPRLPNDLGGFGYKNTMQPNPNCPECAGEGEEVTRMADIRTLSPAARLLYDGVEETAQGKRIKLRARDKALENLAKHLGMFAGKVDPEETNPLSSLVSRIMASATSVPVRPDPAPAQPLPTVPQPPHDEEEIEP